MQTAQQYQMFDRKQNAVSPATCIETLYFEQSYNGQTYRTSLNNRMLITGNNLNDVTKKSIFNSLQKAELPFYYITKINSGSASGLYRLDVSLWSINAAVRATAVIEDLSTRIYNNNTYIKDTCTALTNYIDTTKLNIMDTYLPLIGGHLSGGIDFVNKSINSNINGAPGLCANGENLVIACPNGYISLWGSLSEELRMNTAGVIINKPTTLENGKVLVYNHASSQMVWSSYNAGALKYTTADYNKYYILGITQDSYESREFGETEFIATNGNIETNVYVHRKNVYANAFYGSSDIELKTDIKEIDESTYIPDVIQFKWLDTSQISYGFIALDLEKHGLDYLMDKDDDNHWRVNYSAAISLVVGNLLKKEKLHIKEINILKEENTNLHKQISELENRLSKIEQILTK